MVYSYTFTWTRTGGYQFPAIQVPAPVVPPNPSIRAMNNKGAVAGTADTATSGHAFLRDNKMRDLETLGGPDSYLKALN